MTTPLVERLRKHFYRLPDGYYNDTDYGCNEDCPTSLIMAILDHGPLGTEVMETLTAYDYSIVETEAVNEAADRIATLESQVAALREALEEIDQWTRAYPVSVFPEPDLKLVTNTLTNAGQREQMDRMHASWARCLLEGVGKITTTALNRRNP